MFYYTCRGFKMDNVYHFRIYLILFIYLICSDDRAFGLKCYICQSSTNSECGDVFTLTPDSDDVTGFCRTSCFKFVAVRSDNEVISRGCLPSNRIILECMKDSDGDIYGTFCACNEDFCNHVNSVHESSVYLIYCIVIILYLFI